MKYRTKIPRGKNHSKTDAKATVSLHLNRILVEKARIHRLNLSKITEQAPFSILDYLETQNSETPAFSVKPFSPKRVMAGPEGFEPLIFGSEGRRLDPG